MAPAPVRLGRQQTVTARHAHREDGTTLAFPVTVRIDTPVEIISYRNSGSLQTVPQSLLTAASRGGRTPREPAGFLRPPAWL